MGLTLEDIINQEIINKEGEPSTSEQPVSLLDHLIKIKDVDQDELEDPLAQIGNIGDTVIRQLSQEEEEDVIKKTAFKLLAQAFSDTNPPEVRQKRKYTRWKSLNQQEPKQKSSVASEVLEGRSEKYDVVKNSVFQEPTSGSSEETTTNVTIPSPTKRKSNHKVEEEKWYEQKTLEDIFRQEDPNDMAVKLNSSVGHLEVPKTRSFLEFGKPVPAPGVSFTPFHPGMKYEKEKLFRVEVIGIFMEVFLVQLQTKRESPPGPGGFPANIKKRGRPRKYHVSEEPNEEVNSVSKKKQDLEHLMKQFNTVMGNEQKVWSSEEIDELGRFYEIFKEKLNFTIIQTKELGNFLRKIFGLLEQYEIEREKDALLAEKRMFWQEYKMKNEQKAPTKRINILRTNPVRPYIRQNLNLQGESEEEKKKRKAAYLRDWRVKRAEKQNQELQGRIAVTSEAINGEAPSEISRIM